MAGSARAEAGSGACTRRSTTCRRPSYCAADPQDGHQNCEKSLGVRERDRASLREREDTGHLESRLARLAKPGGEGASHDRSPCSPK
jgi:hypothetical protein